MRGLVVFGLVVAVLGGTAALGSAARASEQSDPVVQADQPDTEPVPSPSDSDDEIRLVIALLIVVAVIALLGTFIYWVRTGGSRPPRYDDSPDSSGSGDTLG